MATKKEDLVYREIEPSVPLGEVVVAPAPKTLDDFAIAALQSVDWNQIGMGVDQAAKLCWSMAEAMIRNKP